MGGESPLEENPQKRGDKSSLNNPLEDEYGKQPARYSMPDCVNEAVGRLPALAIPGAPVLPGKQMERPAPVIQKGADGKITVVGEAEITSQAGQAKITRLDSPGTIEVKRTADGALSYSRTGPNEADNYQCTIKPDGKGGNNIDWRSGDSKTKLQYHWAPSNLLHAPAKQVPRVENDNSNSKNLVDSNGDSFGLDGRMAAYVASPVNAEGDLIFDSGAGMRIYRQTDGVIDAKGKTGFRINIVSLDNQQNKITIGDEGNIHIENLRLGAQYKFNPQINGYEMRSLGPTADGVVSQSLADGVKYSSYNNGLLVIENSDGTVEKIKSDSSTNTETKWLADGTVDITKTNGDGSISKWTFFADYPKGAFLYSERKADGECKFLDGGNNPDLTKAVKQAARDKFEDLSKKHDIYISTDDDKGIKWRDGTTSSFRTPTLRELQVLEERMETYAINKEDALAFAFLQNGNSNTDGFAGLYERGRMLYSAHHSDLDGYLSKADGLREFANSLGHTLDHELGHHSSRRRDTKAWDSGVTDYILAEQYGFKSMEDVAKHKKLWVVEGHEPVNGVDQKFLYALAEDRRGVLRFNMSGQQVNKDGKETTTCDPHDQINIREVADIKFLSDYSYANPVECEAEHFMFYRHGEKSRAALLENDLKYGSNYYAKTENADQIEIDRFKPADKDSPSGYIRIPSGKIVPRTADNEKLVLEFMLKHRKK